MNLNNGIHSYRSHSCVAVFYFAFFPFVRSHSFSLACICVGPMTLYVLVFGTIFWLCFTDSGPRNAKTKGAVEKKVNLKRNVNKKRTLKRMYHWLWRAYLIYVTVVSVVRLSISLSLSLCFFIVVRATAFDCLALCALKIRHQHIIIIGWSVDGSSLSPFFLLCVWHLLKTAFLQLSWLITNTDILNWFGIGQLMVWVIWRAKISGVTSTTPFSLYCQLQFDVK